MDEFKPNSFKSKEEPPIKEKCEQITTGKKRSTFQKILGSFISEDADKAKTYILRDVLKPGIKKLIFEIITGSTDIILNGDHTINTNRNVASTVSYRNYYDQRNQQNKPQVVRQNTRTFEDVIIPSRQEADEVLRHINDLILEYGCASIGDFYDMVGLTGDYIDNKWGWKDISSSQVIRVRDGWMIKLPRAVPLN